MLVMIIPYSESSIYDKFRTMKRDPVQMKNLLKLYDKTQGYIKTSYHNFLTINSLDKLNLTLSDENSSWIWTLSNLTIRIPNGFMD